MVVHERVELAHELGVAGEREVGVDPLLQAREPLLLESRRLRRRERLFEVAQRRSAPERERKSQELRRLLGPALVECVAPFPL
jgi:hypothetical protein